MADSKREPKAVKRLIADAQARIDGKKKPQAPGPEANIHTESSLWSRLRRRRSI